MANGLPGIMAAPNQCEIKARVIRLKRSPHYSDKWLLDIEILESKQLVGPNFARIGQTFNGFTLDSVSEISPGFIIQAKAEYLGGARKSQFQLSEIVVMPTE